MGRDNPNIVQVEFFPPFKSSLGATMRDIAARSSDGMRSKTVLRFSDSDGSVTRLVLKIQRLADAHERAYQSCFASTGFLRKLHSDRSRWILFRISLLKKAALQRSERRVKQLFSEKCCVAMELGSGLFRLVRNNETHETLETIGAARFAWFFIFPHGNILEDPSGDAIAHSL